MTTIDARPPEKASAHDVPRAAGSPPAAGSEAGEPIKILLVDDEPKNLTVLETILADPGYQLVKARAADEALLALVSEEFALIVLDIHMPDMNGFELAQMIKQRKKTASIPIIFLTAYYSEDQYVLEGYQTGAVDYLNKPINPVILRSKVAVFADLYRKTRESAQANRALVAEVAERKRAQEQLLLLNDELEKHVNERTAELLCANLALKRSEAFARSLVECGADCVQVFGLDGKLRWMNENARRRLEAWDADDRPISDWVSFWALGGARAEAEAALEAARTNGIGRFRSSWPKTTDDSRWWDVAVTPIPGPDGPTELFLSVSRDVTEQHEAVEALREADRQKDEFLAMLSHELRNPLAPIRNSVEILRRIGLKDPVLMTARDMIDRQVTHVVRLVDDLLDVSRVSRGKVQLQKEPLDLEKAVQQAVETTRQLVEARRHELTVTLPQHPVRVEGDFTRLAQVVVNLLDNAAKYTERGGKVWISVEANHDRAFVRVRDSGRGIDPPALKRLFELFYQGDRDLDRSEGGLGIGLSLVKRLVEMHGGTVEARSAGRGHGSEFVVCLPCLPAAPERIRSAPIDAPAKPGRCFRILVVDDNIDSAESLAALLRMDGHQVVTAHDGRKGVETALRERPDVVLLDIGLPGLNGYQACETMRAGGLTDTLIVATTGYGQKEDRERSHEAGFDAFQVKPVALRAIRELLANQARRNQRRS
jgi:signal transduction histidine kinase/DNA-binding response OmpR family regulator